MHISVKECDSWTLNKKVSINRWAPTLLFVTYKYWLSTIIVNTHVSVFQTVVEWSKDDSTCRFLLSALKVGHQIEKELWLNHWKGTSHSVFLIPTIDHPGICSWHAVVPCTVCRFRPSPSYSLLLSRMVFSRVVLSLQFFASCVAWDPSFPEVYAWQGTWKAIALDLPSIDSALLRSHSF